jgi:hypothetical protein
MLDSFVHAHLNHGYPAKSFDVDESHRPISTDRLGIRNEADLAGFSPDTRGDTGVAGQNPALTFTPNSNNRNCADILLPAR